MSGHWPTSRYCIVAAATLGSMTIVSTLAHTWTGDPRWEETAVILLILTLGAGFCGWLAWEAEHPT